MLDLGSSVNILPYDIYMMYDFDSLQSTNHTLAMADNTEVVDIKHESTILLGRPFLKTSKAFINVAKGSVVLKIGVDNLETILDGMVATWA
ncbi:50S ribosomal protein L21 chloroplastic [Bienertia sinuspersici]